MDKDNLLWGAARIHGELLKLDIKVSIPTLEMYMRQARPPRTRSQTWSVFLNNHIFVKV
jgi:hypothetical protein